MNTRPAPKPRNPIARQLRSPTFRMRTARSDRNYRRKARAMQRTAGITPDRAHLRETCAARPLRAYGPRAAWPRHKRPSGVMDESRPTYSNGAHP